MEKEAREFLMSVTGRMALCCLGDAPSPSRRELAPSKIYTGRCPPTYGVVRWNHRLRVVQRLLLLRNDVQDCVALALLLHDKPHTKLLVL